MTRTVKTYDKPLITFNELMSFKNMSIVSFSVFFNILYNNLLVNIIPVIATPIRDIPMSGNIELGGFLTLLENNPGIIPIEKTVIIGGSLCLAILLLLMGYLFLRKRFKILKLIGFFIFLLLSQLFILFYCRSFTNFFLYSLRQFRYQFVPNALVILIVLFLVGRFITRKKVVIICLILVAVSVPNIYLSRSHILFLSEQLTPLRELLLNIKAGIKSGEIDSNNKLYIDDEITERLPELCWNIEMGEKFMEGTYQWIFSKEDIKCFTFIPEDAKWIVDENLRIVKVRK